ncbi:MAG: hypothetical protein J7483_10975 [Novosphingobium sp.]|nr:hypothetical protein [Novosphingobium sp.]
MSDFDLLFALLSLLLGLSIAELLAGFARVLRLQARQRAAAKGALRIDEADDAPPPVRIGWLVPLLGAYVLLDQLSFFTAAFAFRDGLSANLFTLTAITVVVGGYYLVATLVFPDDPGDWPDFDRYYDEHNRLILGFALFSELAQFTLSMAVRQVHRAEDTVAFGANPVLTWVAVGLTFATIPLLIAAYRAKRRRLNAVLLALLVGSRLAMVGLSPVLMP